MCTDPIPPKADKTVLYIALGVGGGFLLLCIAPALIIVVCLTAIQLLGKNTCTTFQTVGASIGTTNDPEFETLSEREAKLKTTEFVTCLLEAQFARALESTTLEFRSETTPEKLREMWDRDPVLRKRDNLRFTVKPFDQVRTDHHQRFCVNWTDDQNRQTTMDVVLIRLAAGSWQVSRVH